MKTLKINDADFIIVIQILTNKGIGFEVPPETEEIKEISLTPTPTKIEAKKNNIITPMPKIEWETKSCLYCKKKFKTSNHRKLYCSDKCRTQQAVERSKYYKIFAESNDTYTVQDIRYNLNCKVTEVDIKYVIRMLDIRPKEQQGNKRVYDSICYHLIISAIEQAKENYANVTYIYDTSHYATSLELSEMFGLDYQMTLRILKYGLAKFYRTEQQRVGYYFSNDAYEIINNAITKLPNYASQS